MDGKKKRKPRKKGNEKVQANEGGLDDDKQVYITHKDKFSKVVEFFREADVKDVVKKSDMFKGMEFYIVNVND